MCGEWFPIETAPTDGTEILVADDRVSGGSMAVVFFDARACNSFVWNTMDGCSYHAEAFTHFMPLPNPPSTTQPKKTGR